MDDSDRSREEPSQPEDDSNTDDGTVDSDADRSDLIESEGASEAGSETDSETAPETDSETTSAAGDASDASDESDEPVDVDTSDESVDSHADAPDADSDVDADADADVDDDAATDDDADADDDVNAGDDTADASDTDESGSAESLGDGGTPVTADDEAFEGIEGPETDEEMPLAAHIEEMMRRLAVVFLFGGLATLVVVTESTTLINYFWNYHIPAPLENRPRLYGPLELPLTRLKVAGIAGVVVGLPAFVYQTYRFMKPGLYDTERRYYLAAVPTSLVLGAIGVAFAHFLVLPAIFSYFTTYTADAATIAFGLAETFNLIVIMLAFMAIVFQIPLFIMLAIMMNLVTREWLEAKRLIFWGAFLGIAFLFSPDPTGMAPIIVTLTMIVLFEGTLAILRWTGN